MLWGRIVSSIVFSQKSCIISLKRALCVCQFANLRCLVLLYASLLKCTGEWPSMSDAGFLLLLGSNLNVCTKPEKQAVTRYSWYLKPSAKGKLVSVDIKWKPP